MGSLSNSHRNALLHRLIPATERLSAAGGAISLAADRCACAGPEPAPTQDIDKVLKALRSHSPAKRPSQPGVFTPRRTSLLTGSASDASLSRSNAWCAMLDGTHLF